MDNNKKRYLLISITLGAIAAVSGVLIGLINLITKDQIAKNEIAKVNNGISKIYSKNDLKYEEITYKDSGLSDGYKFINTVYVVKDNTDNRVGYSFKSSGSNMYGKISLLIGFDEATHGFVGTYMIVNEQTYASTLEDNYVIPINQNEREIEDVSCGATYGAKLVRDMINEADAAAKELWNI